MRKCHSCAAAGFGSSFLLLFLLVPVLFHETIATTYEFGYFGFSVLHPIIDYALERANTLLTGGDSIAISATLEDQCDTTYARTVATNYFRSKRVMGILGPRCSNSVLGLFPGDVSMPIISFAATSPMFANRTAFPNFFRASHVDTSYEYLLALAADFNWERICLFSADDSLTLLTKDSVEALLGDRVTFSSVVNANATRKEYEKEIRKALQMRGRVFVFLPWEPTHISEFLLALYTERAYGEGFAIIINEASGFDGMWTTVSDAVRKNTTEYIMQTASIEGAIGFKVLLDTPLWFTEKMSLLSIPLNQYIWAAYLYDSVVSLAIAIERCKRLGLDPTTSFSAELRNVAFGDGMSGGRDFSRKAPPTRRILNYIRGFGKNVGVVSQMARPTFIASVIWPGNLLRAPSSRVEIVLARPITDLMLRAIELGIEDANRNIMRGGDFLILGEPILPSCAPFNESEVPIMKSATGVVSSHCSQQMIEALGEVTETPILESGASAVQLRDSSLYPNYFQLCLSDDNALRPMMDFLASLGVSRVALLFDDSYSDTAASMVTLLERNGLVVAVTAAKNDPAREIKLRDSLCHYIIGIYWEPSLPNWIQLGAPADAVFLSLFGNVGTLPLSTRIVTFAETLNQTKALDLKLRLGLRASETIDVFYAYDSVGMLATALANIYDLTTEGVSRKQLLLQAMRSLQYLGQTQGVIKFLPRRNDRGPAVSISATVAFGDLQQAATVSSKGPTINETLFPTVLQNWPEDCDNGSENSVASRTWGVTCAPCRVGEFDAYSVILRKWICTSCPSDTLCPVGSLTPLALRNERIWRHPRLSVSPKAINSIAPPGAERNFTIAIGVLATVLSLALSLIGFALFKILGVTRVTDTLRNFDQFTRSHHASCDTPLVRKQTPLGGLATLILLFVVAVAATVLIALGSLDRAALTSSLQYDQSGFTPTSGSKITLTIGGVQLTENTALQCAQVCSRLWETNKISGTCVRVDEMQGCEVVIVSDIANGVPTIIRNGAPISIEIHFVGRAFATYWSASTDFRSSAGESYRVEGNISSGMDVLFGKNSVELLLVPTIYEGVESTESGFTFAEIGTKIGRTVNETTYFSSSEEGSSTILTVNLDISAQTNVFTVFVKTSYATIFAQVLSVTSTILAAFGIFLRILEQSAKHKLGPLNS